MTKLFIHNNITINDIEYSLNHLDTFVSKIPGQGAIPKTDLAVTVTMTNHVYSERTKYGCEYSFLDHHGVKRTFDEERYETCLQLLALVSAALNKNAACFESRSFGGDLNLMMLEKDDGKPWSIVFYFTPLDSGVLMTILSIHPKNIVNVWQTCSYDDRLIMQLSLKLRLIGTR